MYEKLRRYILRYGFDEVTYNMCSEEIVKTNIIFARLFAHFFMFINAAIIILYHDRVHTLIHPFLILISFITLCLSSKRSRIPYKYVLYTVYAQLILLLYVSVFSNTLAYSYDDIVLILITIMCFPILTLGKPVALFIMLILCSFGFGHLRVSIDPADSLCSDLINTAVFCILCICMHYVVGRMWYKGAVAKKQLEIAERKIELALESSEIYTWEYDILNKRSIQSSRESKAMNVPVVLDNFPESAILSNYIAPESYDEYRRIHREVEDGKKETSAEIGYVFPDRDIKWKRVKYITVFDSESMPIKAIGCSSDITMEIALRKAKETAERHLAFAIENGASLKVCLYHQPYLA